MSSNAKSAFVRSSWIESLNINVNSNFSVNAFNAREKPLSLKPIVNYRLLKKDLNLQVLFQFWSKIRTRKSPKSIRVKKMKLKYGSKIRL